MIYKVHTVAKDYIVESVSSIGACSFIVSEIGITDANQLIAMITINDKGKTNHPFATTKLLTSSEEHKKEFVQALWNSLKEDQPPARYYPSVKSIDIASLLVERLDLMLEESLGDYDKETDFYLLAITIERGV